jgi:hypothetical protein
LYSKALKQLNRDQLIPEEDSQTEPYEGLSVYGDKIIDKKRIRKVFSWFYE